MRKQTKGAIMRNILRGMNTQQSSLSRYILVVLCAAVVFTTLVLVILNTWMKTERLTGVPAIDQVLNGQSYEDGYKDGFLAAREKFTKSPPLPQNVEIKMVSGEIKTIGQDGLTMLVTSLDTDPLVDGVSDTRTVAITKDTKIIKRVMLTPEEMNKRTQAWAAEGAKKGTPPPAPFTDMAIKLSDLKVGMQISVTSDESLRLLESFTATTIVINQAAEVK